MSDLDAEGVVFEIYENLPDVEGFGAWNEATIENHMDADKLDLASGYFEITTLDGDRSSIHVTAARLLAQHQHAPEFGAAMGHAYGMTHHKNGIIHERQLIIVDLETTGLNVIRDVPVEVATLNVTTGEKLEFVPNIRVKLSSAQVPKPLPSTASTNADCSIACSVRSRLSMPIETSQ